MLAKGEKPEMKYYHHRYGNEYLLHLLVEEVQWNKDKIDISYLKTNRAFDIPIHSRALLAAIFCWLATL